MPNIIIIYVHFWHEICYAMQLRQNVTLILADYNISYILFDD